MRFAVGVPNVGAFGDTDLLVELAIRAEHAGWDGWRLITGFGLGSMDREYADFGEDPDLKARAEKLDEGLDVIVRSWTGEQFSFHGRHHQAHAVRMLPTPVQKPRPPIWLAGRWPNKLPPAPDVFLPACRADMVGRGSRLVAR